MSGLQFLTYRWGQKYETHNVGTYGPQVKEGMSLNDEIHRGDYIQTSAGTQWWGESGFGSTTTQTPKRWTVLAAGGHRPQSEGAGLLDGDQQQWQDLSPLVRHWC